MSRKKSNKKSKAAKKPRNFQALEMIVNNTGKGQIFKDRRDKRSSEPEDWLEDD